MAKKDASKREAVREEYKSLKNLTLAAREAGCNRTWAREVCADLIAAVNAARGAEPDGEPEPTREFRERADGTADLSLVTDRPIKTLDDLVRAAEIDLAVWYVESWEASAWTTVVKEEKKLDGAKIKKPVRVQQHRVKARLKRVMPRALHDATEAIFARMAKHAPDYGKAALKPLGTGNTGEPTLAVLGLMDLHFGKLAWGREVGESYDLKIAERVFANAVDDMLAESAHRNIVKFVFPLGNDLYHVDNSQNKTLAGTPQDVDGRYARMIETGEVAVIRAIEKLAQMAPVLVTWVPGNHDPTTSYHLARTVRAWYHKHRRVEVDVSPSPRKYVGYGKTLLGFTHGDKIKPDDLPNLMASEKPEEWAASDCREWLIGHGHRSQKWVTKPTHAKTSTVVRMLTSLAGTDSWHHANGYVNDRHSAEVLWYGRDRGYAGHALVLARRDGS